MQTKAAPLCVYTFVGTTQSNHDLPAEPGNRPPAAEPDAEFTAWYAAESSRVRVVLAGVCGDAALAEEATAEAFAKAYARWYRVRRMDSPASWVYAVALNDVRSRLRRRRLERRYLAQQIQQAQQLDDEPPPADPRDDLWAAVRQLSPRARTAIFLRYVADLNEPQVAAAMGITRGAVASTLFRARARLADLMAASAEPNDPIHIDTHGGLR